MSVAAVILAAGESTRLGRPKQDVVLNGETLLERAVRVAVEAALAPVIVVLREDRHLHALQQRGATVLINRKAHEGMAASIVCGVSHARSLHADGVMLMTCDQPGVRHEHLRALMAQPEVTTGSAYSGKVGVPAYFPASAFLSLLELQGDTGARDLLREALSIPQQNLSIDIDTEEDFRTAQILFER